MAPNCGDPISLLKPPYTNHVTTTEPPTSPVMHDMDDSDTEEEAAIDVEADEDEELHVTQSPLTQGNRDLAGGGSGAAGSGAAMRKATPFELLAKSVNCLEMHSSASGKDLNINNAVGANNDNAVERATTLHKVY